MVITSPTHFLVFTVPCLRLVLPQSAAVLQDHMDVGCPARKRKNIVIKKIRNLTILHILQRCLAYFWVAHSRSYNRAVGFVFWLLLLLLSLPNQTCSQNTANTRWKNTLLDSQNPQCNAISFTHLRLRVRERILAWGQRQQHKRIWNCSSNTSPKDQK